MHIIWVVNKKRRNWLLHSLISLDYLMVKNCFLFLILCFVLIERSQLFLTVQDFFHPFVTFTEESPIQGELTYANERYEALLLELNIRKRLLEVTSEYTDLMGRLGDTHNWVANLDSQISQKKGREGDLDSLRQSKDDISVSWHFEALQILK